MQLSGKKLTTAILAGLMGATMFGSSVFADTALENVQTLAKQNSDKIAKLTDRVSTLETASSKDTYSKDEVDGKLADKANQSDVNTNRDNISKNTSAIDKEVKDRVAADTQLKTDMTKGFTTIQGQQDEQDAKIAKNKQDIQTNAGNIEKNTKDIEANSNKLDTHEERITTNEGNIERNAESIKNETNNRINEDTALQKNIDKEASDRAAADTQLKTDMTKGFTTIQGQQDEQDAKIAKNKQDIQTNAGNIEKNTKDIEANSNKLADHESRIKGNETNIEKNAQSIIALQNDSVTVKDAATLINANKDAIKNVGDYEKRLQNVETTSNNNAAAIGFGTDGTAVTDGNFVHALSQNTKDPSKSVTIGTNLNALDDAISTTNTYVEQNMQGISDNRDSIGKINGILHGTDGTGNSGLIKQVNDNTTGIAENKKAISDEAKARQDADSQLNTKITNGFATIQGQQDEQDAKIDKNKQDIQTNAGNIQKNTKAIEANSDKLNNHEERISSNEKNIENNAIKLSKEISDRMDADAAEAKARQDADSQLNTKMTSGFATIQGQQDEQDAKIKHNEKGITANAGNIQKNTKAIEANSDKLKDHEGRITTNEGNIERNAEAIKKETNARIDEDKKLQSGVDANKQAISDEVATRQAVDQNLQKQIDNNRTSINDLYGRYSSLKTDINKVGARSAALAGLHPLDFDPANKLNFAVASGSFKGENSVALGAFYRPNENIMFSAASTMGDSDNAYTFGLSFKIGPSSAKTKTTSPDAEELYKVVGELQDQLAAQQKEIEQLKANKAK